MVMLAVDAVHDEIFQLRRGGLYNDWMGKGKYRPTLPTIATVSLTVKTNDGSERMCAARLASLAFIFRQACGLALHEIRPHYVTLTLPCDAAWRAQCLRRLAGPVFTSLGGPSVFAAWRVQ